jgi:hypothetical protein
MSALQAVPQDLYSWDYVVLEDKRPLTRIDLDVLGEGGEFFIHGQPYELAAPTMHSGSFVMQNRGRKLASANRPSVFARGIVVDMQGRHYELALEEIGSRRYVVKQEGEPIGHIGPSGAISRKVTVNLPDEMEDPEKVFLLWLVLMAWRKASHGRGM